MGAKEIYEELYAKAIAAENLEVALGAATKLAEIEKKENEAAEAAKKEEQERDW